MLRADPKRAGRLAPRFEPGGESIARFDNFTVDDVASHKAWRPCGRRAGEWRLDRQARGTMQMNALRGGRRLGERLSDRAEARLLGLRRLDAGNEHRAQCGRGPATAAAAWVLPGSCAPPNSEPMIEPKKPPPDPAADPEPARRGGRRDELAEHAGLALPRHRMGETADQHRAGDRQHPLDDLLTDARTPSHIIEPPCSPPRATRTHVPPPRDSAAPGAAGQDRHRMPSARRWPFP